MGILSYDIDVRPNNPSDYKPLSGLVFFGCAIIPFMQETLESKRQQIKAKFEQVSQQIADLQDQQKSLQGAYSVLGEMIDELKTKEK